MAKDRHLRERCFGLLLLRLGIGISFMIHGIMIFYENPESCLEILALYKIDFSPILCLLIKGSLELIGGSLLAIGIFPRLGIIFLLITSLSALELKIYIGNSFFDYFYILLTSIMFICLLFIGPGKYTLGALILNKRRGV